MLSKSECLAFIQPYEADLFLMFRDAVDEWTASWAPRLSQPTARLRANAIHDLLVDKARTFWADRVVKRRGRHVLLLARDLIGQLKKLGPNGLPRNYPTFAALEFDRQQPLEGIPEQTRVTIGYELNASGTALARLAVVAQHEARIVWSHEIAEPAAAVPLAPPRRSMPRPRRRLTAKRAAVTKRLGDGSNSE